MIAVDPESMPDSVRLFNALQTNLELLSTQGAKFVQAQLKASGGDNVTEAVAQQTAAKELVASTIAVSLQDIAKQMRKKQKSRSRMATISSSHR